MVGPAGRNGCRTVGPRIPSRLVLFGCGADMGLIVLRCIFLMVSIGLGVLIVVDPNVIPADSEWMPCLVLGGMLLLPMGVILADIAIRRKQLDPISAGYFGLIVG